MKTNRMKVASGVLFFILIIALILLAVPKKKPAAPIPNQVQVTLDGSSSDIRISGTGNDVSVNQTGSGNKAKSIVIINGDTTVNTK